MKAVKGILLLVLVFAISAPCFGSNAAIKRKKNKWLYSGESAKITSIDHNSQFRIESFVY
jgi:hypothetical protein